ncbi:MAG: hypothetical protein ACKV19_19555 [Verrucomicrobiales bacterium]
MKRPSARGMPLVHDGQSLLDRAGRMNQIDQRLHSQRLDPQFTDFPQRLRVEPGEMAAVNLPAHPGSHGRLLAERETIRPDGPRQLLPALFRLLQVGKSNLPRGLVIGRQVSRKTEIRVPSPSPCHQVHHH